MKKVESLPLKKWEAAKQQNFDPIVKTMVREGWVRSEQRARDLIEAFLQWFLVANHSEHDKPFVMFNGPVDRVFHAFVLNTEFYSAFCHKHAGKFINHNPLDAEQSSVAAARGGINYTIGLLESSYGEDLHKELRSWVRLAALGKLVPSSISCVGCDYIELQQRA